MPKIVDIQEAVKAVASGANIAVNGLGAVAFPHELIEALEARFLNEGQPRNLTVWTSGGTGGRNKPVLIDRLAHEGMTKRYVSGHWDTAKAMGALALENKIEAFNIPQGVISHLYRAAAGRKPGILSSIGLKTFIDPRYGAGKMNDAAIASNEEYVKVIEIDGVEYLFFKSPKLDFVFVKGTTADPSGNVTCEKEGAIMDILSLVLACKANNGKVFCQVERLSSRKANPHMVRVPGMLIDFLVVTPTQMQTKLEQYNPVYSGETVLPKEEIKPLMDKIMEMSAAVAAERGLEHYAIARRACMEIGPNNAINLGVGIPSLIGSVADDEGISDEVTLTVESGILGGVPAPGSSFGVAVNPDIIYEQTTQFDFYDGGNLDVTFVGAAQIDEEGNVNVSRIGNKFIGVGGFINITQNAKKVVFCTTMMGGKGLELAFENDKLTIKNDATIMKFKKKVDQISFSGELARAKGQKAYYMTERAVFELTKEGFVLTEVAPGLDVEKDIIAKMEFRPIIAKDLKTMDLRFYKGGLLGLKESWATK